MLHPHHHHNHHHHHLNEDINSRKSHAGTHCYVQNSAVSKIWKFTNFLKNITQICQFKIENREKSNLIDIIKHKQTMTKLFKLTHFIKF